MSASTTLVGQLALIADENSDRIQDLRLKLKGYFREVAICTSPLRAIRRIRDTKPELVLVGANIRELDPTEFIRRAQMQGGNSAFFLIGPAPSEDAATKAGQAGYAEIIELPLVEEKFTGQLQRGLQPKESAPPAPKVTSMIVSQDPAMKAIGDLITLASKRDNRVLILGETGTGKQLVAHAIHEQSPRASHPFVEVNCAAIPENLLESELFGHERGSFTGAIERRIGRFEQADRGTLFLDEIGELGMALQSKLLRVLQSGHFNRVGGTETLQSNARIIAATNRDLKKEVEAGNFRADLFYRLHVITITLPPLRARISDVPLLAAHFLKRHRGDRQFPSGFTEDAMQALRQYQWPGNVRELEHLIERVAALYDHPLIGVSDLPLAPPTSSQPPPAPPALDHLLQTDFATVRSKFEKIYLEDLLVRTNGDINGAARIAGLARNRFITLLRQKGVDPMPKLMVLLTNAIKAGDFQRARYFCTQAIAWEPENPNHFYNLGCVEAQAGDQRAPEALAALARATELGFSQPKVLESDSDWASVRNDPRFQELAKKIEANATSIT